MAVEQRAGRVARVTGPALGVRGTLEDSAVRSGVRFMPSHADLLPRYQQMRQVGMQLNSRLVKMLSKEEIHEGAEKLGLLRKNILVLNNEDEMAVLMDYCLHDVRRQGKNPIERYLVQSPPAPDSDEMVYL